MVTEKNSRLDKDARDRENRSIEIERQEQEEQENEAFKGDEDILDEDSPLDFEVEEYGELIPDALENNPAQDYLINRDQLEDDPTVHYTDDKDVIDDFEQRQLMGDSSGEFIEKFSEHHSQTPETSGGDVDAAWDQAEQSGEESVGATNPTPDQDDVEELGKGAGLSYRDDEPLDSSKISDRDEHRWELDPRSADEENEMDEEMDGDED